MKNIAIFGSTGSIGESTLNVVRENQDLFNVVTLVAGNNIEKMISKNTKKYSYKFIDF